MSDNLSPLSTIKESYLPRIGGSSKLGKQRNKSFSIKTVLEDDRPMTPGGILDGYFSRAMAEKGVGASDEHRGRANGGSGWDE